MFNGTSCSPLRVRERLVTLDFGSPTMPVELASIGPCRCKLYGLRFNVVMDVEMALLSYDVTEFNVLSFFFRFPTTLLTSLLVEFRTLLHFMSSCF